MSIRDEVHARCAPDDGRLVFLEPLMPGAHSRCLYIERELHDAIMQEATDPTGSTAFRMGRLISDLDLFSTGERITVGYGAEKTCMMKHLDPRREEVWEIRSRDPKPSFRVFGRFAEPDVFIATNMARRDQLGALGSHEWADEVRRCKVIWRRLFPTYLPHTGESIHDYITENVYEVSNFP